MYRIGMLSRDDFWGEVERVYALVEARARTQVVFGLESWTGEALIGEWDLGDGTTRQLQYVNGERAVTVTTEPAARPPALEGEPASVRVDGVHQAGVVRLRGEHVEVALQAEGVLILVDLVNVGLSEVDLTSVPDVRPHIAARLNAIARARGEDRPR